MPRRPRARRRRRRLKRPVPVTSVLERVYPAPEQFKTAQIFSWWGRAMPDRIVRNARPVRLHNGVLYVHVSTSAWANELTFMAQDLLTRLRAYVPKAGIKVIRFKVGPLPDSPPVKKPDPTPPPMPPLAELPDEIGRALAHLADDDLRDEIGRAATACLARGRQRRDDE